MTLLVNIGELVTVSANAATTKTRAAMRELNVIRDAAVLFDDVIRWVGTSADATAMVASGDHHVIDAGGRVVLPGFVDSHTHVVFAGSRAQEFGMRLAGASYEEIARNGGGILTTMKAVRGANVDHIAANGRRLVRSAMRSGTTTMEIKSGYGLDVESELRLLEAVGNIRASTLMNVVGTFLGAHAVPPEYKADPEAYVQVVINDMLPAVCEQGVAEFCDIFTDAGFFTVEQSERILRAAQAMGLRVKVHADEIANIGASRMAAALGATSADHLEQSGTEDIHAMRDAGVVMTLLPGTAYTLRLPVPDARTMIDCGGVVALATDCNPGSCYCENMQTVLSLACMTLGMSIEEAITASTLHGAHALGLAHDRGSIEVGKRADLAVFDVGTYADIVYHFGGNQVSEVWIGGSIAV